MKPSSRFTMRHNDMRYNAIPRVIGLCIDPQKCIADAVYNCDTKPIYILICVVDGQL